MREYILVPKPRLRGDFLVRDEAGLPKFDDPANATASMKAALTQDDIDRLPLATVEALGLAHKRTA